MDETELDELVDNSFVEIDRFNDETADVGTDIHKVAEIIFANETYDKIVGLYMELVDDSSCARQ